AFGGILGALVQTMVADVIPFERRGKAMGTVMAAFSLSTVAGIPLGLLLAHHIPALGWRAPFFFIVLLATIIFAIACKLLPSLTDHMHRPRSGSILRQIVDVARHREHLKGFAFVALMMLGGFTVIPYIALYLTTNVHMPESFISLVYLCGGGATFFTSQAIGRLADRHGKLGVFRAVALASLVPMLVTTHLVPIAWWLVLINSTIFFVLVPGRMVPAMAMISAVAPAAVRGTYMSLVSSVQMAASGLAALLAGLIIVRMPNGEIAHYNRVGYLAVACSLLAVWLAPALRVAAVVAAKPVPQPAPELAG
ncbi:MAG: MFS transporter, partial [Pseudomonadota bacterium]|nr:MFS transporter [Pseudomonadota bacterium]